MVDTWATAADVVTYTTCTEDEVTDADVTRAQATIDLVAGRLPADAARIGNRDQYWLKLALAYQTAWMLANPDMFERMDVTSTATGRSGGVLNPHALRLAPLALDALKRVSWLRSRSLRVRAPYESTDPRREIYGDDYTDPGTWVPLDG